VRTKTQSPSCLLTHIKGYVVDWDAQKAIWDGMFLQFPKVAPSLAAGNHLKRELHQADIPESSILITEPYFNLPQIQRIYDQFVFEEYEFQSYYRCTRPCISYPRKRPRPTCSLSTAASLIPHGSLFTAPHRTPDGDSPPPPECVLVIDCGFSFTHIVPLISGSIVWNAVKR